MRQQQPRACTGSLAGGDAPGSPRAPPPSFELATLRGFDKLLVKIIAGELPPTTLGQLQRALKLSIVTLTLDKANEALSLQRIKEEAWASERADPFALAACRAR